MRLRPAMATATSAVNSNYFRFASIKTSLMRNHLSRTVGMYTIGFIMCENCKMVLYMVLPSPISRLPSPVPYLVKYY